MVRVRLELAQARKPVVAVDVNLTNGGIIAGRPQTFGEDME